MATYPQNVQGYDYTQDQMYRSGSPETRQLLEQQHQQDISRQGMEQYGQDWLKGRESYYTALQKYAVESQQPGLQQQYADALKSQRLAAAAKGNLGGSNVGYQNALSWGQYQSGLGQANLYGQQLASQAKSSDQEAINNWMQHVYQQQSAQQAQAGATRGAVAENQNMTAMWQQALMRAMQQQQAMDAQRGQFYGGLIGNVGNTLKTATNVASLGMGGYGTGSFGATGYGTGAGGIR